MIKLEDLMQMDGLYYVGGLIDSDGNDWVSESEAMEIINELNKSEHYEG